MFVNINIHAIIINQEEIIMLNLANLLELLKKRGVSEDLSRNTGISSGNISDWKSGRSKPGLNSLIKIADYFDCSVDYLLDRTNISELNINSTIIYRIPKYEQKAAAGVGQLGRDSYYSMEEYIVDNIPNEAVYAMEIAGESMNHEDTNNLLHTGSIVLINPRFIESELDNKIVIANFKGQVICKRYIDKDDYILFQSDNDEFESENRKSSDDPNCKVLGIVLGVIENEKFISIK